MQLEAQDYAAILDVLEQISDLRANFRLAKLLWHFRTVNESAAFASELAKLCGKWPKTLTGGAKVWSFTLKKSK